MAELGVGVRVWVGWCPDEECIPGSDGRCRNGTIDDGPIPPYTSFISACGRIFCCPAVAWFVVLDGEDHVRLIGEKLLYPIDDGGEHHEYTERLDAEIA